MYVYQGRKEGVVIRERSQSSFFTQAHMHTSSVFQK